MNACGRGLARFKAVIVRFGNPVGPDVMRYIPDLCYFDDFFHGIMQQINAEMDRGGGYFFDFFAGVLGLLSRYFSSAFSFFFQNFLYSSTQPDTSPDVVR